MAATLPAAPVAVAVLAALVGIADPTRAATPPGPEVAAAGATPNAAASPGAGQRAARAIATARERFTGDLLDIVPTEARPGEPPGQIWVVRLMSPDLRTSDAQVIQVRVDDDGRFLEASGRDLARAARPPAAHSSEGRSRP